MRTGAPWSLVKDDPFISVAKKALDDWSSSTVNIQLAPGKDVVEAIG
jgi:hypothetical protein